MRVQREEAFREESCWGEKQIHPNEEELAERFAESDCNCLIIQLFSCEDNYSAASLIWKPFSIWFAHFLD